MTGAAQTSSNLQVFLPSTTTEAQLQAAINGLPDGGKIILAADSVINISQGLVIDTSHKSITVDLNGSTLKQTGDCTVVTIKGNHDPMAAATLGVDSSGNTTATYAGAASSVKVGDWIKITSDDSLSNDQGAATHMGQAMQVTAIHGNTLSLNGTLIDAGQYQTNVEASGYNSGLAVFENGAVQGDQSHPTWEQDLVQVRSTVGTQLTGLTVEDGNSMGMNFVDTVNGSVTQSAAINLTDDTVNGHYGYGVHSASSWNTTVNGLYAQDVRHAVDDNAVGFTGTGTSASKYGADYQLTATNVVAYQTTAFAFSWHSEGRYAVDHDSVVIDSAGVLGARGVDNTAYNISGVGNADGVMFYEYGSGDGRNITVSNLNLTDLSDYAVYSRGTAVDNAVLNSTFQVNSNKLSANGETYLNGSTITVSPTPASVTLTGSSGNQQLLGGDGADTITGGAGADYIFGGKGADTLIAGAGQDRFAYIDIGEAGDTIKNFKVGASGDVIDLSAMAHHYAWQGDIFANGYVRYVGSGANTLVQVDIDGGGHSFQTLATLQGVSVASLSAANVSLTTVVTDYTSTVTTASTALVSSAPTITGTAGSDHIFGTAGADRISGGAGNDVLVGGAGADVLMGGGGFNTASYETAATGVIANLLNPGMNTGDAAGDTYSQIQGLLGSSHNDQLFANHGATTLDGGAGNDLLMGLDGADTLYGGTGNDTLYGGDGADHLYGGAGNDILDGGSGYNILTGGDGADTFRFSVNDGQKDTITDFQHGLDVIAISRDAFGLSATQSLTFAVDKAHMTSTAATFYYDGAHSTLYFDPDGKGAHAPIAIAELTNVFALTAPDLTLF